MFRFTDVAKVVGCYVEVASRMKKGKDYKDDINVNSGGKLVILKLPLNIKSMNLIDK